MVFSLAKPCVISAELSFYFSWTRDFSRCLFTLTAQVIGQRTLPSILRSIVLTQAFNSYQWSDKQIFVGKELQDVIAILGLEELISLVIICEQRI